MSPSESELRAALRDGEGDDVPDVDGLVAHVRARRGQRRVRVLSAAAAVVVVAAAAGGAALLRGGSDGGQQGAGPSRSATPSAEVTEPAGPAGAATSDTHSAAAGCPSSYPARPVTGPSRAAAAGRMFADPVKTVLICAYTESGAATGVTAAPLLLVGDNATALAESIEQASPSKLRIACPAIAAQQQKQLAIIGVTASGRQLPTVSTDVSIPNCNQPITNGTAVRYAWKPPASLEPLIDSLTTGTGRSLPTPSGHSGMNGTPAR